MTRLTLPILVAEAILFGAASLVHAGILIGGYEHATASIAEAIIALVLAGGVVVAAAKPAWTRPVALAVQAFALLGDSIGTYLAVIGVGASTIPDIVFHVGMLVFLVIGIAVVWNERTDLTTA
jgi:hypothetical protein